VSGTQRTGRNCEPAAVFELADRALDTGREREVRRHLRDCSGCRELYEREMRLNERLSSLEFSEDNRNSVCENVVMALPTRPIKTRFLWALTALGILATALFALIAQDTGSVAFIVDAVESFQGASMLVTDLLATALAAAGPVILGALIVGALLDVLLVTLLLSVARRRTRTT
jgi:predicted anti-sigma-YlaC factor YlaD